MKTKPIIIALMIVLPCLLTILKSPVTLGSEPPEIPREEPLPEFSLPGVVEGTGTYFEITDSEYLDISLQSTEEITVRIESTPKTISLNLEASSVSGSTTLTLGDLEPSVLYSKFEDSYKNKVEFTANESGSYTWTQDLTKPHHVWFQPEDNGTVFLPTDCTKYGTWDSATSTCTLTKDLTESVEITANNIVLDCNNHKITWEKTGYYGIYLNSKQGITIRNCIITHFAWGIRLWNSPNNNLANNTVSNNSSVGIYLLYSDSNTLTNNAILYNYYGISLWYSNSNILTDNNVLKGSLGISLEYSNNNTLKSNSVSYPSRGIWLKGSSNNTLTNNTTLYNYEGVVLLYSSNNNTLADNNASNNYSSGIYLLYSDNNKLINNIADSNEQSSGITLSYSNNNILTSNSASSNYHGIILWSSNNNTLMSNTSSSNSWRGISLGSSNNNTLRSNTMSGNKWNFGIDGTSLSHYIQNVDTSNLVDGKPIYYWVNQQNRQVPNDAGFVGIVNSLNITVRDLTLVNNLQGVLFASTINSKIESINASNNLYGIFLDSSDNNIFVSNTIQNNYYGIQLSYSNDNKIYHNNFKDNKNKPQAKIVSGTGNVFDNGYPPNFGLTIHGGNFWSDYAGVDLKKGPSQDQIGGDGIGDTPYVFTGGRDKYPFMKEDGWAINLPPVCSIKLREKGTASLIDKIDIGESFDIYVGDSTDDTGIEEVRFLSDDFQDNNPTGEWTEWYNWKSSSGDWNAQTKIKAWLFSTIGNKEVWAELKDDIGQTSKCFANISALWIFDVAVILAEPNDVPHESEGMTAQPCKLLDAKTYPNGHNKDYFEDLAYCVADYHKENSFGMVNLDFTDNIFDNNGNWFKTTKDEEEYLGKEHEFVIDVINLATDVGVDLSDKNIVIVIHSGTSYQKTGDKNKLHTRTWAPNDQPSGYPPYKAIGAEKDDLVGAWAHEIGHIIGVLITPQNTITPDIYKMGRVGKWDLMAHGSWNDGGNNPPYMSSYTKEFLQWLNYDIYPKSAYGEYWIDSLETNELGNKVFRYNLSDDTNDESPKYYILEARNKGLKTWDSSLPEDKALVLYNVDTKGYPEYGYALDGSLNNQYRKISIPFIDGILTPDGDSHLDMAHLVYISALSDEYINNIEYRIKSKIEKVDYNFFEDRFRGAVLEPSSQFYQKVIKYLPFRYSSFRFELERERSDGFIGELHPDIEKRQKVEEISIISISLVLLNLLLVWLKKKIIPRLESKYWKKIAQIILVIFWIISIISFATLFYLYFFDMGALLNIYESIVGARGVEAVSDNFWEKEKILTSPLQPIAFPDLDLHLYCNDGRHVGMNYQTGEYEIQIPEAIVSGDNQDAPEWIFVPQDITNCRYVVSSYDNQKFLEENPEIAQQIEDTTDSYEIYARYIDPEIDIYTSTTIPETIDAGVNNGHIILGTHEETTITPADKIPPTTTISLSDNLGNNNWYLSDVTVTFMAQDNENGVGVEKTEYSLDNGQTWIVYTEPFVISNEGITNILYRSQDFVSNLEETKEQEVKIDKTKPEITISEILPEYIYKDSLTIEFSAEDEISGIENISATLNDQSIESGQTIILDTLGTNTLKVIAEDKAGNIKQETREFKVYYQFSGFLPPLHKKITFKLNQDIPVKFQIQDKNNNYITDIQPRIYLSQIINQQSQPEIPAKPSGKSNQENITRYDTKDNQYIYNLSTKDLSKGDWQIRADLTDESQRTVIVNLK